MPKSPRQLDHEIAEALSGHSRASRSSRSSHATVKNDRALRAVDAALRHYAKLTANPQASDQAPDAWGTAASRIEAAVEAAGLTGDAREFAMSRARDARNRAQVLRLHRGPRAAHSRMKEDRRQNDVNSALRRYAKLSEATTVYSPGHTPDVWNEVASQIEAGVKTAGLKGDEQELAMSRARSARSNARWLQIHARRQAQP